MELLTFINPNLATFRNVLYFAKRQYPQLCRAYFIQVSGGTGDANACAPN